MTQTETVPAIDHGTVIDHILSEKTLEIARLLDFAAPLSIAVNLSSARLGAKGVIKVHGLELSAEQTDQLALLSPDATINIIQDFQVVAKRRVRPPDSVTGLLPCPNPRCITNHEAIPTRFSCRQLKKRVELRCHYCEKCH